MPSTLTTPIGRPAGARVPAGLRVILPARVTPEKVEEKKLEGLPELEVETTAELARGPCGADRPTRSPARAARYVEGACAAGLEGACATWAGMPRTGVGAPADVEAAVRTATDACAAEDGDMLREGRGVARDGRGASDR